MDKNTLSSRLSRIEEELPKLSNTISAMKITDTGAYGKNYEELSLDAAQRAERIACSLRNLIFAANLVAKPLLMEKPPRYTASPSPMLQTGWKSPFPA